MKTNLKANLDMNVSVYTYLDYLNESLNKFGFFKEISNFIAETIVEEISPISIEKALLAREALRTTGFGDGFAIPHGKVVGINKSYLFFIRSKNKLEWDSLDKQPVQFIFIILVPDSSESNDHLTILSRLSYNLMDASYQEKIKLEGDNKKIKLILEEMLMKNI